MTLQAYSTLDAEIASFAAFCEPNDAEIFARNWVIKRVEKCIQTFDKTATIETFGSFKTGLSTPLSDIDIAISLPTYDKVPPSVLDKIAAKFVQLKITLRSDVEVIRKARVPLVKLKESTTRIEIDCSFNNVVPSTSRIRMYMDNNPKLRELYLVIKNSLAQQDARYITPKAGSNVAAMTCLYPKIARAFCMLAQYLETRLASNSATILNGILTITLQARNARLRMNRLYINMIQDNKEPNVSTLEPSSSFSHDFPNTGSLSKPLMGSSSKPLTYQALLCNENSSTQKNWGSRLPNHMHSSPRSCLPLTRNIMSRLSPTKNTSSSSYLHTKICEWMKTVPYDKENVDKHDSTSSYGQTDSRDHGERVKRIESCEQTRVPISKESQGERVYMKSDSRSMRNNYSRSRSASPVRSRPNQNSSTKRSRSPSQTAIRPLGKNVSSLDKGETRLKDSKRVKVESEFNQG
ncbi:hypothetical protein BC937DRAFT_89055 [Endogone sp. FLAS-F59071]|nr:hypothetical protein BC937DRAFT_89055 [Endogone sp. FLAS-F59071]|eukprot:RUS18188.1 hypothetical protein BC937DRAFT_89055 [Endogone sp. FLAS-F59071]